MSHNRPSIVLLVIDALRYDCVPSAQESPYLHIARLERPELPAFTELVQGAHYFTQAITCGSQTPICHASLFTGLLPPAHGVRAFAATSLSHEVRTLAEILTDAGYKTCVMTDASQVFQPVGLLRGFETLVEGEEEAFAWWDANKASPRFLFLHLWDLHKPYGMPFKPSLRECYPVVVKQWRGRLEQKWIPEPTDYELLHEEQQDRERAFVFAMQHAWEDAFQWMSGLKWYLDGLVTFDRGRLRELVKAFQFRGMLQDTLMVVTADHGEGRLVDAPKRLGHGNKLLDDTIRIPLYLRIPGGPRPRTISAQVSQADIMPTLLEWLGLIDRRTSSGTLWEGRSLLPLLRGEAFPDQPAYAEHWLSRQLQPTRLGVSEPQVVHVLHHRVLRYPDRKYSLIGQPYHITEKLLKLSAVEFLETLYRDLLGIIEDSNGFNDWLGQLRHEGPMPNPSICRQVFHSFQNSETARRFPKYTLFDLVNDPLEEHPIGPEPNPMWWSWYLPQLEIMLEIDRHQRPGGPLLHGEDEDEGMIIKRLQALGYLS